MSSRHEKAMFKAEKLFKIATAEHITVDTEYNSICKEQYAISDKWRKEHPENIWGYNNEPSYKATGKKVAVKYNERTAAAKRYYTTKLNFELKQRQWQDFLLRDSQRIRHCSCGERDNSAMVQCDECDKWVHLTCANLTEKEARALDKYECPACFSKIQAVEIAAAMEAFIRHEAGEIDDDGNEVPDKE